MLMCKDLRRSHQSPLTAVLHRLDEGEQRNRRLPRADIPLHETAHRQRRLHVARNFRPHLLLIVGQCKGQCCKHACDQFPIRCMCDPLLLLCRALLEREQPALNEVQFLECKPPPRRTQFLLLLWEVNAPKGSPASDETILLTDALRQVLFQFIHRLRKRIFHHLPQLLLRQPLGRRIDGQDAEVFIRRILCTEEFKRRDLRERKLSAPLIGIVRLAREEDALPLTQLRFQKTLVEPDRLCIACPIAEKCRQHRKAAPPRRTLRHLLNHAEDSRTLSNAQLGDGCHAALIFVDARIIRQEIIHRSDAETRKCRRLFHADTTHLVDAVREVHRISFPLSKKAAASAAAFSIEQIRLRAAAPQERVPCPPRCPRTS